jgi:hypothetical protein
MKPSAVVGRDSFERSLNSARRRPSNGEVTGGQSPASASQIRST